jgi:hypothetical protein
MSAGIVLMFRIPRSIWVRGRGFGPLEKIGRRLPAADVADLIASAAAVAFENRLFERWIESGRLRHGSRRHRQQHLAQNYSVHGFEL